MIYVIDIDGTICTQTNNKEHRSYNEAKPYADRIKKINKLYDDGHEIVYFTARGSSSGVNWKEFTKKQLTQWGVKYHVLVFGKPTGDVFIDDKAINSEDYFSKGG